MRSPARKRPKLVGILTLALALGQLIACGVDGMTPDCSDAAVCAPSAGDAASAGREGGPSGDATATADAAATDGAIVDSGTDGG